VILRVAIAAAVFAGAIVAAAPAKDDSPHSRTRSHWCPHHHRFRAYYLGASFRALDGHDADVYCSREPAPGYPGSASVSYGYGDCHAAGDNGCALPLEVQSAPLCERHPALYEDEPGHRYPHRSLRIRGVPAASYDGGTRLEVYTRQTTIVLFGERPKLLRRAARVVHLAPRYNLPTRRHVLHDMKPEHPQRDPAKRLRPARKRALAAKRSCGPVTD
jgi:hypothetical protein